MDFLAARRKQGRITGHPIIKARANIKHDVTAMHGEIGFIGPVHAGHANELLISCWVRTQRHQSGRAGKSRHLNQLLQQLRGFRAGVNNTAAGMTTLVKKFQSIKANIRG